jgi:hypothetical protein
MPICITAKQKGYCRCNTVFSDRPTNYPDGHFNPGQLAQLKSDPGLHVVVGTTAGPSDAATAAAAQMAKDLEKSMTVAQLTEELTKINVQIPAGAKKADLIALLIGAQAQE